MNNSNKKIGVTILGGTGYGAAELLRILAQHPTAEVISVCSTSQGGKKISDTHPQLAGFYEQSFVEKPDFTKLGSFENAVAFCSLPHGTSISAIEALLAEANGKLKLRVVDLSGDLRLKNPSLHQEAYPDVPLAEELREKFIYGLAELNREKIRGAQFVSNPGRYATTCALSVLPLMKSENVESCISFDAKSGSSGAGRSLAETLHHPLRNSSMTAYKVLTHRHEPEILETISGNAKRKPEITFTPQLLPISRGIFVTTHLRLKSEVANDQLLKQYAEFYHGSRFIRISARMPELAYVVGSNFCDISLTARKRDVVVVAALDNLVKGMAGQAIQNMNLMCGLPEETGLLTPGLGLA